jgi:hypothetical protein
MLMAAGSTNADVIITVRPMSAIAIVTEDADANASLQVATKIKDIFN